MTPLAMGVPWLFVALAVATWVGVPAYAGYARGRLYAAYTTALLSFAIPPAIVLHSRLIEVASPSFRPWLDGLFVYSMAAAGLQLTHLVRARMRSRFFRLAVSMPGQTFIAAGMLAGPWLLAWLIPRLLLAALDLETALRWLTLVDALPLVVGALSIATSLTMRPETVRFRLSDRGPGDVERVPVERFHDQEPEPLDERPLRVVQITDTHLGPWQSVTRLRNLVAALVARDPDLVALTGDFLTMESMGSPGCLERALIPLERISDRCVAIFGNHDHEAPEQVVTAMRTLGIRLLIDDEACLETPAGPVQIVGSDFVRRDHEEHFKALLTRFPRREGHLRLMLLHDPVGFRFLPPDEVDLVLSGHTHGGQVGLVSLGLDWTVLSRTRWPDHGLFARGGSRLYVHRGTGFYGFPLRVGVPAELSVLEINPSAARPRSESGEDLR